MLVDSHCHIPLLSDSMAVDEILGHARDNDIEHMLCVAIDMEGSPEIIELANRHEMVSASVGVHPNTELTAPIDEKLFLEMAADKEVVAVGETGLDYFRSEGDLEWQRDRFRLHIKLAKELGKPLIIHTREAKEDTLLILKEQGADAVGGVMHCFVEDWETAQKAMDLGFYISFSGIVTFKNARELQDVARQVPLEQMLVETDSPYLAPVPYRGKTNQPAFVRHVAEFIAELKQVEFTDVAEKTTANYYKLFN